MESKSPSAESPRRDREASVELTPGQRQIWTGQTLHPDCPLYNMAFAFVFPEALDVERFQEAWRRVVMTSDALRTVLTRRADGDVEPWITLDGASTQALDLSDHDDPVAAFHRLCRERCARPLDVEASLVDSVLIQLGSHGTGWYLNQHHLITDAWSTRLLYQRVADAYQTLAVDDADQSSTEPSFYAVSRELRRHAASLSSDARGSRRNQTSGRAALYGRDT
ncbi:MAG: condensation domain-containing protein [Acidobacteriota bacterium]